MASVGNILGMIPYVMCCICVIQFLNQPGRKINRFPPSYLLSKIYSQKVVLLKLDLCLMVCIKTFVKSLPEQLVVYCSRSVIVGQNVNLKMF